jgi:hypothetical protein
MCLRTAHLPRHGTCHHRMCLQTAHLPDKPPNLLHEGKSFLQIYSSTASQEISPMLWTLQLQYHVQYSLPLVPVHSQINPVHILQNYLCKIYFNIICSSTPIFPEVSFLQVSPPKHCTHFIFHLLTLLTQTTSGNQYKHSSSKSCNFCKPPVTVRLPHQIHATHTKPLTWPRQEASSAPQSQSAYQEPWSQVVAQHRLKSASPHQGPAEGVVPVQRDVTSVLSRQW